MLALTGLQAVPVELWQPYSVVEVVVEVMKLELAANLLLPL